MPLTPPWQYLVPHRERLSGTTISDLFAADPARGASFSLQACDLFIDYSKQGLDPAALQALLELPERCNLALWRQRLFAGEAVNISEQRPALHTALRQQHDHPVCWQGVDQVPLIRAQQARMQTLAQDFAAGRLTGYSGEPLDRVVNIGIGGSYWGPALVVDALGGPGSENCHFVSNLDPLGLERVLSRCDPARTLFVVSSKSFTTRETLLNARAARQWLMDRMPAGTPEHAWQSHFVAVTANPARAMDAGYDSGRVLVFWDWVGGRYSLWSAIGLPAALTLGWPAFAELLAGAAAMDDHFASAPWHANAPVILGLLDVWHSHLEQRPTRVVLPYDEALRRLPTWLQQLDMESNGKGVDRDGQPLAWPSERVVWGDNGNDGQHTFFQLLHQGSEAVAAEFIVACDDPRADTDLAREARRALVANCLAQSRALMIGSHGTDPARNCPGNRPSTTLLLPAITPRVLGALLALYEHRTFVRAVCWRINPFDQWGVELGKRIAGELEPLLANGAGQSNSTVQAELDGSTRQLLQRLLSAQRN